MFSPIRIIPIVATVMSLSILPEKRFPFALIFLLPVRSRNLAESGQTTVIALLPRALRHCHLVMMRLNAQHSRHDDRRFREPVWSWHPGRSRNSEMPRLRFSRKIGTRREFADPVNRKLSGEPRPWMRCPGCGRAIAAALGKIRSAGMGSRCIIRSSKRAVCPDRFHPLLRNTCIILMNR
jgi:hypothetical protein